MLPSILVIGKQYPSCAFCVRDTITMLTPYFFGILCNHMIPAVVGQYSMREAMSWVSLVLTYAALGMYNNFKLDLHTILLSNYPV